VDMACFSLFLASLVLLYSPNKYQHFTFSMLAGIFLGFTFWIRYAYLPQTIALIGIGLMYDAFYNRIRVFKVWFPVIMSCGILLLLYFLRDMVNNPGYIDENSKNLYFSNLKRFNIHVFGEVFIGSNGLQRFSVRIHEWIGMLIGIFFSIVSLFIIYKIHKQKGFKAIPPMVGLSVIFINISLLVYLSLTNAPQTWTAKGWTFVEAHRYYAPTWAILWLSVISAVPFFLEMKLTKWIIIGIGFITILDFGYYAKWKLTGKSLLHKPGMHQLSNYDTYHSESLKIRKQNKIPVYTTKDPGLGLIAESAGWLPLRGDIMKYELDTQKVIFLAIQYPLSELPAHWNWKEKIMDSGSSVYLTNN
jgi:hypothetical protein